MAQIKFIQLTQTKYNQLVASNSSTITTSSIFFTTDTGRIYKGDQLFTKDFLIVNNVPTDASKLQFDRLYVVSITGDMYIRQGNEIIEVGGSSAQTARFQYAIESNYSEISALGQSKLDITAFNAYSSATSDTLASLADDIDTLTSDSSVTLSSAAGQGDILNVYTITQGSRTVGTINIPKDLVVTSGSVVKGTWDGAAFTEDANGIGTALKLVIANQTNPVYINTLDLVKDHTGSTVDGITVTISDTNAISVSVADGSIAKGKLASDVQKSLALADTAVQDADLVYTNILTEANGKTLAVDMNGVKERLDALEAFQSSNSATIDSQIDAKIAELDSQKSAASGKFINSITMVDGKITAIGESEYTLTSGSANGTVSFNGTDVAVTGLGSAAFTNANAYDAAGAASSVQSAITGTANDEAGTLTLHGLANSINDLNADSSTAGSIAYQIAQASSSALTAANTYTDKALTWATIE